MCINFDGNKNYVARPKTTGGYLLLSGMNGPDDVLRNNLEERKRTIQGCFLRVTEVDNTSLFPFGRSHWFLSCADENKSLLASGMKKNQVQTNDYDLILNQEHVQRAEMGWNWSILFSISLMKKQRGSFLNEEIAFQFEDTPYQNVQKILNFINHKSAP